MHQVGRVAFVLLAAAFLIWMIQDQLLYAAAPPSAALAGAAAAPVEAILTGTLTYAPDDEGGQVAYLVYKTASGATMTKVLDFTDTSRCMTSAGNYPCVLIANALPSYYGASVLTVAGAVANEHIVVDSITPA